MKKKWATTILAAAMTLSLLSACGGEKTGTAEPSASAKPSASATNSEAAATNSAVTENPVKGTIVFLTNRTDMIDKEYNDYEKRFEAKYPEVDLQFEAITDYDKNVKIRIASNEYPDVVLIPSIPNTDLPNYFAPLDDIAFSGDIFFKDFKAQGGSMYGVASGSSTTGIVYNKNAFKKAGITAIPKTLDEFYAAADKLKAAGIVPLASNFKDKWPLDAWVYDAPSIIGGSADHQNQRVKTDTPYTLDGVYGKSFSILRTMYEKGYLEPDINSTNWEQSKKDVASGKAGMYFLGSWVINQVIENGAASEDIGFFPFPTDNSGQYKAPLGPDWFYAVNKNGNVEAGKAFVKWMVEESGFDDFAGFIPVLKDKEPKLAQLAEFNGFTPNYLEAAAPNDDAIAVQNKAQIDQSRMVQEFVLGDPQKVFDKYNAQWAAAKKSLGK